MQILLPFALIVFFSTALWRQFQPPPSPPVSPSPSLVPEESRSPTPTSNPTPTPTPTPTPSSSPAPTLSQWQFPGSARLSDNLFTTPASPAEVTSWYQSRIESEGFSAKSFIRTNANDRVKNKLVAAGSGTELTVEISKDPQDSVTTIKISY